MDVLFANFRPSFQSPDGIRCASPPSLADRSLTSLRYIFDEFDPTSASFPDFPPNVSTSELPCDKPDIRILGLSGLYSRTLPGSLYESLFGTQDLDLPPISQVRRIDGCLLQKRPVAGGGWP